VFDGLPEVYQVCILPGRSDEKLKSLEKLAV
jgi:hypothetical protein